jgi:hypothetical protein
MKYLPTVIGLLAIGMSGFAVPPEPAIDRTEIVPLAEPVPISIDDLALSVHTRKEFKNSHIPKRVWNLDGKRVRLIGIMMPTFEESGIKEFTFNGDTQSNWYSWNADSDLIPVQYYIPVKMQEGSTTSWTQKPIEVEGRLIIEAETSDDGSYLIYLYRIEEATVRPGKRQKGFKQSMLMMICSLFQLGLERTA